jgi:hypothetical protein
VQSLVPAQTPGPPGSGPTDQKTPAISDAADIWALDEKLKDIKSPELRAALRRLGGPVNDSDNT